MQQKSACPVLDATRISSFSWLDRLCRSFVERFLSKITRGSLLITYPDGRQKHYGSANNTPPQELILNNYKLFRKIVFHGGIGLGESYVEGDWSASDLSGVLKLLLNNWEVLAEDRLNFLKPIRFLHRLQHTWRENSVGGSRENVKAHYDLSNELFKLFLDDSMTYSCALFSSPEESLEQAQRNKLRRIMEKAKISRNDRVLEIGSGWGSFALMAAREIGCSVTSITVSEEQLKLAQEKAIEAGLQHKVDFIFCDYRNVSGEYDVIVSIEMLEAVGHEYLTAFFETCERVLRPGGAVVLQFIAMPDQYYHDYRMRSDWIQKHIFPGSHLPSLGALLDSVQDVTSLVVENIENIGLNYARTLAEWRQTFLLKKEQVSKLGYDEKFMRTWEFYLTSCEAEFATRWLSVYQVTLTPPNNSRFLASPGAVTHHRNDLAEARIA